MRNFLIGLVLTIAGIAALVFIPSKQAPAPMPWETTIMPDGNAQVFGLHLGKATFKDAQNTFKVYGKTAIFSQADHETTVEAYFNSVNLGGLSAKVVLNLNVDEQLITPMLNRAVEAKLQPSGARRYKLHHDDHAFLLGAAIKGITYIPSIRLDEEAISARFGKADNIEQPTEQTTIQIWHYPRIGLTVTFNTGEKTVLQYSVQD